MCGVAGIFSSGLNAEYNQEILIRMLSRIQHRGPDESGIYLDENVAIGNVRLSIIDLAGGQQPMSSPDKRYWIVYNGEIFNYLELKQDLLSKGHVFQTTSDTEVLLHLFVEYGKECLSKLNGQFAFAIWDRLKGELFLARDRVGIRPLYYFQKGETFVFGSEIKTLLEYPGYKPAVNWSSLSQIFSLWTAVTPLSIFENINELPPGHYMMVSYRGTEIERYWSLDFSVQGSDQKFNFGDAVEQFGELLQNSVSIRLRADVTVAAYLSGGLDSSATTALIKKIGISNLKTYSIGFADKEFDETSYQNEVSNYLKTNHTSYLCTSEDVANIFPEVIWHTETPIMRTAPAPMYLLSKKVREQNIKVVITGEGADEILAGYDIFKETLIREFWSRQSQSKIRPLLLKKLYPYIPQIANMNPMMLKFAFGYKLEDVKNPFYSHLMRWNNSGMTRKFFTSEALRLSENNYIKVLENHLPMNFTSWGTLEKAQWLEMNIFMSGYLLSSQGDRMGMANSIEGRFPFLDYRIIEFCSKLPSSFKMKGINEKYLLKKYIQGKIPDSIVQRPKQSYRAPIESSFINYKPDYFHEILSEKAVNETEIFDYQKVNQLFKGNSEKPMSEVENMAVTGIVSTQLFIKTFIEKDRHFLPPLRLINPKIIRESKNFNSK